MTTTLSNHPLADQLAVERHAADPKAQVYCCSCSREYPLAGIDGIPSLRCPHCGYLVPEDMSGTALKRRAEIRAEKAAKEEAAAPAPTEVRGDPPGLDDVIGNPAAVMQIRSVLDDFRIRQSEVDGRKIKVPFPHLLLSGPGGTGKTMLAEIIAREIKRPMHIEMGQSLGNPARVVQVLCALKSGAVLFIDEIHGLKPQCQETLYRGLEDGIVIPIVKAGQPVSAPIRLPAFTLIGATTDKYRLLPPLRQRLECIDLARLTPDELLDAIGSRAVRMDLGITRDAVGLISERSLGTPRLAMQLLNRCVRSARIAGDKAITIATVQNTCTTWGIDRLGLDATARKYLRHLEAGGGAPVRVNVLATKMDGLSRLTVERTIEPDMVWLGLIEKRADGRVLTQAGREFIKGSDAMTESGTLWTPAPPQNAIVLRGLDRQIAARTIIDHHYTHSIPSGKSHYIALRTALVVWSIPANKNIARFILGFDGNVWELSRLWAPDGHEPNLLTQAISEAVKIIVRLEHPDALVSYADPNAGHKGGVYRAASWLYHGQCEENRTYCNADGQTVARRAFHSGGGAGLTKAQILERGYQELRLPGKERFVKALSRAARKAIKGTPA